MIRRIFFLLILSPALLLLTCALWWLHTPLMSGAGREAIEWSIAPGSTSKAVAASAAQSTGASETLLGLWFRSASFVGGRRLPIRAGTYAIEPHLTPFGLLGKLVSGDEVLLSLTIVEGWTFAQMRKAVNAAPHLSHTTAQMSDSQLMTAIGKIGILPEGQFFPDTYRYTKHASDEAIYRQAASALERRLQATWDGRLSTTALKTPSELLILASIIEKETGQSSDRAKIAGVFMNRLNKNMMLQTDPSVIYGMGERFAAQRKNIRRADLLRDTPYNTYTRSGLPPSPIALVGAASLAAAAQPIATSAFYFVARGDGSSQFSDTLSEHNKAVQRYIKGAP